MSRKVFGYDEWWSDACCKGGDGYCDGYIPEGETVKGNHDALEDWYRIGDNLPEYTECSCVCHELNEIEDMATITDYVEFHKEFWRE